jgi:membrane protease YdiL (CAAX protease family)
LTTPPSPHLGEDPQKEPMILSPRPPRDPAWGLADVLALGAGTFLVINVVAAMFLVPLASARHLSGQRDLPLTLIAKAVIPAEVIAYALLIVITKIILGFRGYPSLLKAVNWNWPPWRSRFALIGSGMVCAVVIIKAGSLFNIPPDLPIEEMMKDRFVANMFLVFGILPAPFVEELYFRGLLYPALNRRIGNAAAIVLTAAAFAGMHASQLANTLAPLVMLFAVGLVLTLVRARTGSVAASFILHMTYNGALFLLDALAK